MKGIWSDELDDTHVFMGLGNHDYDNNVDDCAGNNCANRMWDFMRDHRTTKGLLTTDFDHPTHRRYSLGLNLRHTSDDDGTGPLW